MNTLQLNSIINDNPEYNLSNYSCYSFMIWLNNRLKYKYKENSSVIDKLSTIIANTAILPKKLTPNIIDKCCRKHFVDFDMEKTYDFKVGYTDEEREDIRKLITDIYNTVFEYQCNNE